MYNSIVKIDLHEDGKTVTVEYKGGSVETYHIKNIKK
jgi:hypothetical protein